MMWLEVLAPGLAFGVANSAHCAGMCGVFALRAGSGQESGGGRTPLRMALYLSGKTFTYVFLGAVAGLLGAHVLDTFAGAQPWLAVAVGAVLVIAGVRLLVPPSARWLMWRPVRLVSEMLAPAFRAAHGAERHGGPFALGLATGFLPCGVVYLAAIQGAALGTPFRGALLMAAFGLGTVPVLLAVGLLGRAALSRIGPMRLRLAGGIVVLLAGLVGMARGIAPLLADGAGGAACCH